MSKALGLISASVLLAAAIAAPAWAQPDPPPPPPAHGGHPPSPPWPGRGRHGLGPHRPGFSLHQVCLYQDQAYSPGAVVTMAGSPRVCGVSDEDTSRVLHWLPTPANH